MPNKEEALRLPPKPAMARFETSREGLRKDSCSLEIDLVSCYCECRKSKANRRRFARLEIRALAEMHRDIHVRIRHIVRDDAFAWQMMRQELWPDGAADHAPEIASFFAGTLREPTAVMVAEDADGVLVGFVELSIRTDVPGLQGKRAGYVEGLYVRPEFRHRGIARTLLQASRKWAHQQECDAFASDRAGRIVIDRSF